jgi:hypothetical protein
VISLILNFRDRHDFLNKMFDSLIKTTEKPQDVEVYLGCDNDDSKTTEMIEFYQKAYAPLKIKFYFTERSDYFTRDYINPMARLSKGDWLMVINDDVQFLTPGWDRIIEQGMKAQAEKFGDSCLLGYVKDRPKARLSKGSMACFMVLGRDVLKALGVIHHEDFWVWGADHAMHAVFCSFKDRIKLFDDVLINHYSVHTGQRDYDDNHKRFCIIHDKHYEQQQKFNVQNEVDKINHFLYQKDH